MPLVYALIGVALGFLICWILARSAVDEMAAIFETAGYKLVDGVWTRPNDPTWKLK